MATPEKPSNNGLVEKAESIAPLPVGSLQTREIGQPGIVTSSFFIQDQKRRELAMPMRFCTFDVMAEDDSIYTAMDVTNLHVTNSLYSGEFRARTPKGQLAADFLNYCIRNMTSGTWLDVVTNAATDIKYGFSLANIVTEKRNYGRFAGARCLKKISPRDQKSVYGWLWDKDFRELQGFVQKPPLKQTKMFARSGFRSDGIAALSTGKFYESKYPIIRKNQLLHFRYNDTNDNPQGNSPLMHCYQAWKEKDLIQRYEVVGVSKDLGGAVVMRVPSELLDRAQDATNYPADAASLAQLKANGQALHAGESSLIMLPSDVEETTKTPLYDFKLQGIEGGGKQYNTSDIIQRKNRSIYNTFGAAYLLLGQESEGSYSLSTTAKSTHAHYVQRNILQKTVILDTQLAPRLLAANGILLDWADMPFFEAGDPEELDLEVVSKMIQRTATLGMLTPAALRFLYEKAGLPTEGIDDLDFTNPKLLGGGTTPDGTGGTGDTQTNGDNNTENDDAMKSLVQDGKYIINAETGEEIT